MARGNSAQPAVEELTAEEQAQLDQMRADDAQPETPPESESVPEPVPDADAAPAPIEEPPPAAVERQRTAPISALHEERERRRQAEQRIVDLQKSQQTLEERTNLLLQRFNQQPAAAAPPQPQAPPIPDVATDPVGYIAARLDQQQQQQTALTQWALQQEQQRIQQTNTTSIQDRALALERQFASETPDYAQAVDHLATQRRRELEAAGFVDPAERELILRNEALQLAQRGIQNGRNPAQMIYDLAKIRGYQSAASSTAAADPSPQPQITPQQRLEQVRNGQQQSRSLGSTRGTGPTPLTADRLLAMTPDEFDKMLQTPEGRDLMGS